MKAKLMLSDLLNQLSFALCIVRRDYRIMTANEYFQTRAKVNCENFVGQNILELFPDSATFLKRKIDTAFVIESSSFSSWEQQPHFLPFKSSRPVSGKEDDMYQDIEVIPIHSDDGALEHVCICVYDVTTQASQQKALKSMSELLEDNNQTLNDALKQLKDTQVQLLQSEKLASIGQLSAGIAHEINNPIGFITSNAQTLQDYFNKIVNYFSDVEEILKTSTNQELAQEIQKTRAKYQLDFILEDVEDLIKESLEGADRVVSIVKNLKDFSHIDNAEWNHSNLINGMESTLKIINNEIKYSIEVERHYADDFPLVLCQPMQLNQVFLNILVNASQAIDGDGKIIITMDHDEEGWVSIAICDTGCGIPEDKLNRIFEPFFTTKPVGSGTGLGLSVSYGIINAHKGKIEVTSQEGEGTCFTIRLPVEGPKSILESSQE
ncbi:ATP-binding protein [Vibrio palustris]|uniref:histidine kinase n=1 Tax=Vibrio palustris TaxID=1918946 RepID=A0A1R4B510_9VIBR|nr:ATP-binding protein [Vibrio palustris]SJL83986.1 Sporulation kinase E [Vibrio palustris]